MKVIMEKDYPDRFARLEGLYDPIPRNSENKQIFNPNIHFG
jgi:hypothetical protein